MSSDNDLVFVTGGSGYLGRNLIRRLVRDGRKVRALARSDKAAAAVEALGAEAARGDILDAASLRHAMQGCTRLIHAAADTGHGTLQAGQHHTNLQGTRNVFAAAREAGVTRAVHISTESVLLSGEPLRNANEDAPIPATHAGSYSSSKAAAERAALEASDATMQVMVVRPRFVWGRDDTTALPALAEAARSGKLMWIGGGTYRTSTAHIDNVAEGVLLALEKGRGGRVYFVTDGEPREFRAFVSALLQAVGVEPPTRSLPRWLVKAVVVLGDRLERWSGGRIPAALGTQEYGTVGVEVTLDISRARSELGYRPVITVEEGLRTVELPAASAHG